MQRRKLFVASCVSLVTTSMVFAIRGDIEAAMSSTFQINASQMGTIWSPAFWAFTIAIFISGAIVDGVGLRALHILSAIGYFIGIALVLLAPHPTAPGRGDLRQHRHDDALCRLLRDGTVAGAGRRGDQPAGRDDLQRREDEMAQPHARLVAGRPGHRRPARRRDDADVQRELAVEARRRSWCRPRSTS